MLGITKALLELQLEESKFSSSCVFMNKVQLSSVSGGAVRIESSISKDDTTPIVVVVPGLTSDSASPVNSDSFSAPFNTSSQWFLDSPSIVNKVMVLLVFNLPFNWCCFHFTVLKAPCLQHCKMWVECCRKQSSGTWWCFSYSKRLSWSYMHQCVVLQNLELWFCSRIFMWTIILLRQSLVI